MERLRLFEAVRAAVPPSAGVLLVAGTGAPSTRQARSLTAAARDCGVDAVLARSPRCVRPLRLLFGRRGGGRRPARIRLPLPGGVTAGHPARPAAVFAGRRLQGLLRRPGPAARHTGSLAGGWLYVGSAALLLAAGQLGCAGAILAPANAAPELCAAAFGGDPDAQRKLTPAHLASQVGFPRGIKRLAAARFGVSDSARVL